MLCREQHGHFWAHPKVYHESVKLRLDPRNFHPIFITLFTVELIILFCPMDQGSFEMGPHLIPPHYQFIPFLLSLKTSLCDGIMSQGNGNIQLSGSQRRQLKAKTLGFACLLERRLSCNLRPSSGLSLGPNPGTPWSWCLSVKFTSPSHHQGTLICLFLGWD